MSRFIYLLSEGVHDIAFLYKLLKHVHGAARIEKKSKLDDPRKLWIESFKWPIGDTIDRLSVPAPQFLQIDDGATIIGMRNSGGIDNLTKTLTNDLDILERYDALPDTIGIFLDSDKEPQQKRFSKLIAQISRISTASGTLQPGQTLATIGSSLPRVGVFAFPLPGKEGALEDLLLDLGNGPYHELCNRAQTYVAEWSTHVHSDPHDDWKELKGQSGSKKATFAIATAMLRPGRGTAATLEDNRWISEATQDHSALEPCLKFVRELLSLPNSASNIVSSGT